MRLLTIALAFIIATASVQALPAVEFVGITSRDVDPDDGLFAEGSVDYHFDFAKHPDMNKCDFDEGQLDNPCRG